MVGKRYSIPQYIALTIVPMVTAALSLSASGVMITMVLRSKKKLKDAYRRLIFGMSVFDIFHSFAMLMKIFKTTPDPDIWATFGNQTSCDVLGFFHILGIQGAAMYSVSLSIYYLYVIKYNMRERVFRRKVEPWLHAVPTLWNIFVATFVVATRNMSPAMAGGCWVAQNTKDCDGTDINSDECRKSKSMILLLNVGFIGTPMALCLLLNVGILTFLWYTVRKQENKLDRFRIRRVSFAMNQTLYDSNGATTKCGINEGVSPSGARRWGRTPIKSRDVLKQASCYFVAFLLTYITIFISQSMKLATGRNAPFALLLVSRIFNPLQGLFNIIVYTRPHVRKMRDDNPDLTWFRAFWRVVRQGGDDDDGNEQDKNNARGKAKRLSSRETYRKSQKFARRTFLGDANLVNVYTNNPNGDVEQDDAVSEVANVPQSNSSSDYDKNSDIMLRFRMSSGRSYNSSDDHIYYGDDELEKLSIGPIPASEEGVENGSNDSKSDILDDFRLNNDEDEEANKNVRVHKTMQHDYHNENQTTGYYSSGEDTYVHKNCELGRVGTTFDADLKLDCNDSFSNAQNHADASNGTIKEDVSESPLVDRWKDQQHQHQQECRLYATDIDEEEQIIKGLTTTSSSSSISLDMVNNEIESVHVREALRRSLEDSTYGENKENLVL